MLIAASSMLLSCSSHHATGGFKDGSLIEIEANRTIIETIDGSSLQYCGDGCLLMGNRRSEQILLLVNTETKSCECLVKRGRGHGEAAHCWDIFKMSDEDYCLYSAMDSKIINVSSINGRFEIKEEILFPQSMRVRFFDGNYLYIPLGNSDKRLILSDANGTELSSAPFPAEYKEMAGDMAANLKMQCLLDVGSRENLCVTVGLTYPYMDIFSHNLELTAHVRGPFEDTDSDHFFTGISIGDKNIMTGIAGKDKGTSALLKYDLKGKPVSRYNLPEALSSFDIDWKNGRVFGVEEKTSDIVCYKMIN